MPHTTDTTRPARRPTTHLGRQTTMRTLARHGLLLASLLLAQAAAAFDIYQLPMFATGTATPNVMLLVDNSGSMDNIIWADGFDVRTNYPDWSSDWDPNDGNVHLSELSNSGCSGGRYRGKKGTVTKCLKLPDPVGGKNTRYDGNYLNYLFETYANNTDLTTGTIPTQTRMQVARQVATDLVNTVTGVRFGLSTFYGPSSYNSAHGATILEPCNDADASGHNTNLVNGISGLSSDNNTPLAEALYEITRYFRGLSSYYHGSTTYTSPLQFRCQKNFTVVITDGFPTYDTTFPSNDPADPSHLLPNWDGKAPATSSSDYPLFPQWSDGFKPSGSAATEGYSLYLDDIAKFGFDIDFKTTGSDNDGVSWNDPEFPKQNMSTYTVGFATANQMLQDAADYSGGQYFTAKNAADLKEALENILLDIQSKATAAASVAANSTRLSTDTLIYQARYDSSDWSGDLQAYPLEKDADGDVSVGAKVWSANEHIPAANARRVVTQNSSTRTGIDALWADLSGGQQNALKLITEPLSCSTCSCTGFGSGPRNCRAQCSKCTPSITGRGDEVLAYLRGNRSGEAQNGGDFRDRSTVLGDIVNSDPLFVGTPDYGYQVLPGTEGSSYKDFRASAGYQNRAPMVYVGANDGMLHAIDGSKTGAMAGVERFAYIPLAVYPKLKQLTDPNYIHKFFVDGSPAAGDAYIDGAWKTVLVGTLGGGGRGVFALDITDPTSFGPTKVLWDKAVTGDNNINITDDADLGYTYGQASIGRLANGQWAAIFGNGLNSGNKRAVLFVVNLQTGAVIKKIDTGYGGGTVDNGLSTPSLVDADYDRIVDYVYAGDMQGNLWKFDLTANSPSGWKVAYASGSTNQPLFVAKAPDGSRQPITSKPEVTRRKDGDLMVFFGTGKYFEAADRRVVTNPAPQVQTFYGVRDPGSAITTGRTTLVQQSVITTVDEFGYALRVTTANQPTATQPNGWYLDLPTAGERQVSKPQLRSGRLIFTTVIPNSDACYAGGDSWLMEMDALTGSRFAYTPFDLNNDNQFSASDFVTVTIDGHEQKVPVSGKKYGDATAGGGVVKTPAVIDDGGREVKVGSLSTGAFDVTKNNVPPGEIGRQSWRQLQ